MKKYLVIDKYDDTRTIRTEKELRDLYFNHLEDMIYYWDYLSNNNELLEDIKKERDTAYTCDFSFIKRILESDTWYYEIKEIEVI